MIKKTLKIFLLFFFSFFISFTQSTSQDAPTPITSNQITGIIKPRPASDDRPVRYFYVLESDQGDLFVNVETENFDGDIDLFVASNLKPLAKITIYSANTKVETGRVVYFRKPERVLLRIEGKTPNDLPASFSIKFAGSFVPVSSKVDSNEGKTSENKLEQATPTKIEDKKQEVEEEKINSASVENKSKPSETSVESEKPKKSERGNKESSFAEMQLVIVFKDGQTLEKSMEDVSSFQIDEQKLVIKTKDGKRQVISTASVLGVSIQKREK
ncbi:MAG: hypothetical protein N2Z23_10970 [Pyrinomonadaceae bacterium]|nr:hypothetical protein [Pyrinomonadaceae bacterium]